MSRPTLLPDVIDALIALFGANSMGATVFDGYSATADEPNLYVMVGVENPDITSGASSGGTDQTWAYVGAQANGRRQRNENITVNCGIVSWDGGSSQKNVRDKAFQLFQSLTDAIEHDPTLGGIVLFVSGISNFRLMQNSSETGVSSIITFTVQAQARP